MIITPDIETHKNLELEVTEYLESKGFLTGSLAYHHHLSPELINALKNNYSLMALYLRTKADRFAINSDSGIIFEYECKTKIDNKSTDLYLELFPVIIHLLLSKIDNKCLYCCNNIFVDPRRDYGFWIDKLPSIDTILIPDIERNYQQKERLQILAWEYFPDTRIKFIQPTRGSNDPFLIIKEQSLCELPHWKILIQKLIESKSPIKETDIIEFESQLEPLVFSSDNDLPF